MRTISKGKVDELIRVIQKYQKTGDVDYLPAKHKMAEELSREAFGRDISWINFSDLVGGCVNLNKAATNNDIYCVLNILGFELTEDKPHDPPRPVRGAVCRHSPGRYQGDCDTGSTDRGPGGAGMRGGIIHVDAG